jgi:hypothetical protein
MVVAAIAVAGIAGRAWLVHAGVRKEARHQLEIARSEYRGKSAVQEIWRRGGRVYDSKIDDARETERAFMSACRKCAPPAECERDRLVIASGRATDSYNPCD